MPYMQSAYAAMPHKGSENDAINTGRLSTQEKELFSLGIPLNIIMEGARATTAYAREHDIELPEALSACLKQSARTGMSNPFVNPPKQQNYNITSDDFLG